MKGITERVSSFGDPLFSFVESPLILPTRLMDPDIISYMSREKFSAPSSDEEYRNELERKKEAKRENRLRGIVGRYSEDLASLFPDEAGNFDVVYEKIEEYWNSMFGHMTKISFDNQPAYGIFVQSRSDPSARRMIEHLFRQDLDAPKATFDLLSRQSFADNITKAVEQLKLHRGE